MVRIQRFWRQAGLDRARREKRRYGFRRRYRDDTLVLVHGIAPGTMLTDLAHSGTFQLNSGHVEVNPDTGRSKAISVSTRPAMMAAVLLMTGA